MLRFYLRRITCIPKDSACLIVVHDKKKVNVNELNLPNAGATLTTRTNKMMPNASGIKCLLFFSLILPNICCLLLCGAFFVVRLFCFKNFRI